MPRLIIIFSLLSVCCLTTCTKENNTKPYTYLNVRFFGDEEDVQMETIFGNWDFLAHIASLEAIGYRLETFHLYLPQVTDTGNYTNLEIKNISLSDGLDFQPIRFQSGFIHVTHFDAIGISGEFRVFLEDDFNGGERRLVVGAFGINQ